MELIDGIKHIIDGNAVVIMGAGASYGAENAFGEFPSGANLAKDLYALCGIVPDDEKDLQDASQSYEEQFGPLRLIHEIRTRLTCTSFTDAHEEIYSLPWMRYYTTNYDDVALLAAKKRGKILTPVTLTSDIKDYKDNENLCVHINGHVGNPNQHTLHHEFKLTSSSYLSQTNILNSQWGDYFANDLDTARCIVIIGLSLKYDLDLSKIIFNSNYSQKTIIIDSPYLTSNAEHRLSRFGTVYKIGIDNFARSIKDVKKTYFPNLKLPVERLYVAFQHEYHRNFDIHQPKPDDIFRLLLNGQYNDCLFHKSRGRYTGFIYRGCFYDIKKDVLKNKKYIFVHSDMGNGKTACLNELRFSLSREDLHIFTLINADSKKLSEEIAAICTLAKECRVLVIIDDYTNYMEVLHKFALLSNENVQFILTARSALNYNKMPIILADFLAKENESALYDLNRLDQRDLENCVSIFDQYGLFGERANLLRSKKIEYLSSRGNGAGRFQSIMLDAIQSDVIKSKIDELIKLIKEESYQYHYAVILTLLIKVMNLRLSPVDIERIADINITTDALFKSNPAIKELLIFNTNGSISIKAPVTARYILQKTSDPDSIINALCKVAHYAEQYSKTEKFANILTSIISYSHISSFLSGFSNPEDFLSEYYDQLSKIEYYQNNNFFWLQYAISCIETQKYSRAQQYLKTAYGLIPPGFVPFQINNQQARFYFELVLHGKSTKPKDDLLEAHKLLMIPIASSKDNEFNVIILFRYYYKHKIQAVFSSEKDKTIYKQMCKEALDRLTKFVDANSVYEKDLRNMKKDLLAAYYFE